LLRLYIFINSQEHIELKIAAKPLPDWARQTAKDWASQLNSGGAGSGGGGGGGSDSDAEDFDPFDNGSSSSSGGAAIMCRTLVVRSEDKDKWQCNVCTFSNDAAKQEAGACADVGEPVKCQMCASVRVIPRTQTAGEAARAALRARRAKEKAAAFAGVQEEEEEEEEEKQEEEEEEEDVFNESDMTMLDDNAADSKFRSTHRFANGETVMVED
jgi:hypothetical protein